MSNEKFKVIREKLFDYITHSLIINYEELCFCNMYESLGNVNWDVEFIFKLNYSLTTEEKNNLKRNIKRDLRKFLNEVFNMPYYHLAILIILDDT